MDHFLDLFHSNSTHRKQAILFLNELMLGTLEVAVTETTDDASLSNHGTEPPSSGLHRSDDVEHTVR